MENEILNYETFYEGGYSSLNPEYGNFIGYRIPMSNVSSTTSIQSANQVNEVILRIREGVKNVELQPIQPEIFEQIPNEQFKEIKAIMKLTGVKPSLHAPMIDPAGFGEQGYQGDLAREDAEKRLFSAIEKGHKMDSDGNIPIVVHSSAGIPGTEWRPEKGIAPGEEGRFKAQRAVMINQESKEMKQVEEEEMFLPGMSAEELKKGEMRTPKQRIAMMNLTGWDNEISSLTFTKKQQDEINNSFLQTRETLNLMKEKIRVDDNGYQNKEDMRNLANKNPSAYTELKKISLLNQNNQQMFLNLFHKAYKYGTPEQKEVLEKLSGNWNKEQRYSSANPYEQSLQYSRLLDKQMMELQSVTDGRNPSTGKKDENFKAPEVYKNVENFAMDKAAETFGNIAFKSYNKFGDKAPIIAVENWQPGAVFSRAKDLKDLIKKSKEQFVKRAVEEGESKSTAEKQADKLIGATWDLGHLNQLRKWGFTEEDIIKETEKIAKLVKHVHLTDNFGYSDSHLAPGMGNVPFKKILEKLEKAGALRNAKQVIEAGALTNPNLGLKMSPLKETMRAMGSGIYGAKLSPYWNQVIGMMGSYIGLPIAYVPEKHFSTYGTGLGTLPQELGGQIPGTQSRFSGTESA